MMILDLLFPPCISSPPPFLPARRAFSRKCTEASPVQSVEGSLSVSTPHSRKIIIQFPLQHQGIEDLPASGPSSDFI
ncbi:hypothetical protein CDAR_584091 [Caerostris darwini]|uniref:Uncharacterized protein n=1 Tax=Caerostris darwini TaxID=1538125 RepID=A0AAV4WAJ4_9ARAC|nr:hypothetical protein CDAR_584091 [Caerostris darwini]